MTTLAIIAAILSHATITDPKGDKVDRLYGVFFFLVALGIATFDLAQQ